MSVLESGARLAGARRMCGYLNADMAADALGVGRSLYRGYETGEVPLVGRIAKELADRFGVTSAYLRKGEVGTYPDRWANERRHAPDPVRERWGFEDRVRISERLRMVRLARGFRTVSAASTYFGWPSDKHSEIEAGRRRFTAERLAEFAYAFDVTEQFLLDSGVPLVHDDGFFRKRDGATLREFLDAREQTRQAQPVSVPFFRTPMDVLALVQNVREATAGLSDRLPLTVGLMEAHGCPTENVIAVRVPDGSQALDFVLGTDGRQSPCDLDAVLLEKNGELVGWQLVQQGRRPDAGDPVLRLPLMMTISQSLRTVEIRPGGISNRLPRTARGPG